MSKDPDKPATQTGPASWERMLVIVPPVFLGLISTLSAPAAPLLILAVAWVVAASLILALRRGIVHGDRSAFTNRQEPPADHTKVDLCTRTGLYQWMRDSEEQLLHNDHPPD